MMVSACRNRTVPASSSRSHHSRPHNSPLRAPVAAASTVQGPSHGDGVWLAASNSTATCWGVSVTTSAVGTALLHLLRSGPSSQTGVMRTRRVRPSLARSAFAGFCFPPEVIVLSVRWYLRFALSYRDVEELLAERGVEVDHVTVYRWVLRFTPLLAEAARPCRHAVGDRWQVDETYVKVAGQWRYVYRAIDQFGQVIDVFVSPRRDTAGARRFFERAIGTTRVTPIEVTTDRAAAYPPVLDDLLPATWHRTDQYANNRIECDHGRLKARLRPMRGLKQHRSATVVLSGHALVQNLRRRHYELAVEEPARLQVAAAFDELALAI